ncbi:hypothetical protein DFH28DRAFT_1087684 [Melampsora americana]|nr:hypothetical protein DFH28DRAFT_1087684 [Melampsora americana]
MDSESFQDEIDERLRRKQGENSEQADKGRNERGEEKSVIPLEQESKQTSTQPTASQPNTRSAKRKGKVTEGASNSNPDLNVGPVRIKKPKVTKGKEKEQEHTNQEAPQDIDQLKPTTTEAQQNDRLQPPPLTGDPARLSNNYQETDSEGGSKEGKPEADTNYHCREVKRIGGIALEGIGEQQEDEIEIAFNNRDRQLYDKLSEDKRCWTEFWEKKKGGGSAEVQEREVKEINGKKRVKIEKGKVLTGGLVALPKYWDTVMKDLNRYIPLSIFEPTWLRQDMSLVSNKSSRARTRDADAATYNGSPIPSEWRTTAAQWHSQKELFIAYLEWYKQDDVAASMKEHFANVLEIQKENDGCWVFAFRYDIEMRQTYMTFKVGENEDMADIGVRNPKIERKAERDTLRHNDDVYLDNPYAFGMVKCHIDPIDGSNWEGKTMSWDDPGRGETKGDKNEISRTTQSKTTNRTSEASDPAVNTVVQTVAGMEEEAGTKGQAEGNPVMGRKPMGKEMNNTKRSE